jgi:hypothetical protein
MAEHENIFSHMYRVFNILADTMDRYEHLSEVDRLTIFNDLKNKLITGGIIMDDRGQYTPVRMGNIWKNSTVARGIINQTMRNVYIKHDIGIERRFSVEMVNVIKDELDHNERDIYTGQIHY